MVERLPVKEDVAGSTPAVGAKSGRQMVESPGFEPGICRFKSYPDCQNKLDL